MEVEAIKAYCSSLRTQQAAGLLSLWELVSTPHFITKLNASVATLANSWQVISPVSVVHGKAYSDLSLPSRLLQTLHFPRPGWSGHSTTSRLLRIYSPRCCAASRTVS